MRRTKSLLGVSAVLMEDPKARHWGYDLMKRASIQSGVLYPILNRMEVEGWLTRDWEEPSAVQGRPLRRYYELTDQGRDALKRLLG